IQRMFCNAFWFALTMKRWSLIFPISTPSKLRKKFTGSIRYTKKLVRFQKTTNGLHETANGDWLGDIGFASTLANTLFIAFHGESRHCDNRDRFEFIILF